MATNDFKERYIAAARAGVAAAEDKAEKNSAMAAALLDLRYVETRTGDIIDLQGIQAAVAWHMIRCGWRPIPEKRMIKSRRIIANNVAPDAIEWVDVRESDDPLADLANMTMTEINALPVHLKAQALTRMGAAPPSNLPDNPGWKVETNIQIQDSPDPNDNEAWTTGRPA